MCGSQGLFLLFTMMSLIVFAHFKRSERINVSVGIKCLQDNG